MRIAITGSTGLVGSSLVAFFKQKGHDVLQISRQSAIEGALTPVVTWDPDKEIINKEALEGLDVVIHLAGTNVGERWDGDYKKSILDSRVKGTRFLSSVLGQLRNKPKVLLSASAVGFYGNHAPGIVLDESSPAGDGFLPQVCQAWEQETLKLKDVGVRVVHMRFGVILSRKGGALAKMWVPFQLGLGGILGDGKQMMSFIALNEIPFIVEHLIQYDVTGPVNVVAPRAVSNKEFTNALGKVISRPVFFPVPAFAVKLLFGEMGERLLLEGVAVLPRRLQETNYQYHYPDITSTLREAIK